jgi:hypothetical protein
MSGYAVLSYLFEDVGRCKYEPHQTARLHGPLSDFKRTAEPGHNPHYCGVKITAPLL